MNAPFDPVEFRDLCADVALGLPLDGDEQRRFDEARAAGGDEAAQILAEVRWTVAHLAVETEPVAPDPAVRERILRAVTGSGSDGKASGGSLSPSVVSSTRTTAARRSDAAPGRRREDGPAVRFASALGLHRPALALATLAVLLVGAVALIAQVLRLGGETRRQGEMLATQTAQLTVLRDSLSRQTALLEVLGAPLVRVARLDGQDAQPSGYGKVIWDPEGRRAILQVANLPTASAGQTYQLWAIHDKTPVSAGLFDPDDGVRQPSFYRIDGLEGGDPKDVSAFAITVEPAGGVPQPTGPMVLLGSPRSL